MASTYSATNLEEAYANGIRIFENEDFSNKDIRGRTLVEVTFVNCNLENSSLDYAILNGCRFICCNLKDTRFKEADLSGCLIEESDLEDTSFFCTNLIGAKFEGVVKDKADFQGAFFEEKCYVESSTHDGKPISGVICTKQEYLEAIKETPDFCGSWREFSSRKEAQSYIDNYNSRNVEEDANSSDMFPIAFQSWHNGGIQTSAVHYSNRYNDGVSEFDDFVEKHNNSNTFATLHICHNVEEWDEVYKELFGDDE